MCTFVSVRGSDNGGKTAGQQLQVRLRVEGGLRGRHSQTRHTLGWGQGRRQLLPGTRWRVCGVGLSMRAPHPHDMCAQKVRLGRDTPTSVDSTPQSILPCLPLSPSPAPGQSSSSSPSESGSKKSTASSHRLSHFERLQNCQLILSYPLTGIR